MQFRIVLLLCIFLLALSVSAQQPVSPVAPAEKAQKSEVQLLVETNFGEGSFHWDKKFQPLFADFDGDGKEDIAIVVFGKNPLANSNAYTFKVVDPYDAYFGVGDVKITSTFSTFGDGSGHCVLVVHDWKIAQPKARFVILNVPFDKLGLSAYPYKKRTVVGLRATEMTGLNSVVFWDGKKYRWEPTEFDDDSNLSMMNAK